MALSAEPLLRGVATARVARGASLVGRVVRRVLFWLPAGFLVLMALACFFLPALAGLPGPNVANLLAQNLPVGSAGHLLGTDSLGYDLFSRVLVGGRVSLEVGLSSATIGLLAGSAVGTTAGYLGGASDTVLMRIVDVFLAFPAIILALCIAAYLGPGEQNEILAISFFTFPNYARLSRSAALRLRVKDYVAVTQLMGGSRRYLLRRHLYPNLLPELVTIFPITVGIAMVIEAALSFLGLGIRPPAPSWGNMISAAQEQLTIDPWSAILPSLFLVSTVLALNLVGERLRGRLEK